MMDHISIPGVGSFSADYGQDRPTWEEMGDESFLHPIAPELNIDQRRETPWEHKELFPLYENGARKIREMEADLQGLSDRLKDYKDSIQAEKKAEALETHMKTIVESLQAEVAKFAERETKVQKMWTQVRLTDAKAPREDSATKLNHFLQAQELRQYFDRLPAGHDRVTFIRSLIEAGRHDQAEAFLRSVDAAPIADFLLPDDQRDKLWQEFIQARYPVLQRMLDDVAELKRKAISRAQSVKSLAVRRLTRQGLKAPKVWEDFTFYSQQQ